MTNSSGGNLIVVSNAEPYKHVFGEGDQIQCREVGGGLTTAMNPRMRKTGGVWIAYGRGEADFEAADSDGQVKNPAHRARLEKIQKTSHQKEAFQPTLTQHSSQLGTETVFVLDLVPRAN